MPEAGSGYGKIFVYDRQTGQTEWVSPTIDGNAPNGNSRRPSISADGRYVTFYSGATNLVVDDNNSRDDIFVYDRVTSQTERVSLAPDGSEATNHSLDPVISADGHYVAFTSSASNLVPGNTNQQTDVFLYDRQTGQMERVSLAADGSQLTRPSSRPSISANGRFVCFGVDLPGYQLFVYDRQMGLIDRVTQSSDGTPGNSISASSSISADGRFVAFSTEWWTLVPGTSECQICVYDRQTDQLEEVSLSNYGYRGNDDSLYPSISADGRFVAFYSYATNFAPDDTNGHCDVFIYDRQTDHIDRVSLSAAGVEGNNPSYNARISADGRLVAFISEATNLVSGDTNGQRDVFVTSVPAAWVPGAHAVVLAPGETASDVNFGNHAVAYIHGFKWSDVDGDGLWDQPDERVLNRWTIYIDENENGQWDGPGVESHYAVTARDGSYTLGPLEPGTYTVAEVPQAGWTQTCPDTTVGSGNTYVLELGPGEVASDMNFGNQPAPSYIEGSKFHDLNGNGQWDQPDEPALEAWMVYVDENNNGQWDGPEVEGHYTTTSAGGSYGDLPNAHTVILSAGQTATGQDFGNWQPAYIEGFKWNDLNGNGQWDQPDEPPLQGYVYIDPGYLAYTAADGSYTFGPLEAGTYTIANSVPVGWAQTYPDPGSGGSYVVTVAPTEVLTNVNFGNWQPAYIEGFKWIDHDGDGQWDQPNEPGLEGWTIYVDANENGQLDAGEPSTTTTADGSYMIGPLAAGAYTVAEVLQSGWMQTSPGAGAGGVQILELTPGETASDVNFGNQLLNVTVPGTAGPNTVVFLQVGNELHVTVNDGEPQVVDAVAGMTLYLEGLDGADTLVLYDTDGTDRIEIGPTGSRLRLSSGVDVVSSNFETTYAAATGTSVPGERDSAVLYGSSGSDALSGFEDQSLLTTGVGAYCAVFDFGAVEADVTGTTGLAYGSSSGSTDDAYLYDSALNDLYHAEDDWATMDYNHDLDALTEILARGFDPVWALHTNGTDAAEEVNPLFITNYYGDWN